MGIGTKWTTLVRRVLAEEPLRPEGTVFRPTQIIAARGARDNGWRQEYLARLRAAFPEAEYLEQLKTPAARVRPSGETAAERRRRGKETLVVGTMGRLVDQHRDPPSDRGVHCYPYWHFNCVGHCPFDCSFCYVQGSQSAMGSPAVKFYVNLEELLARFERVLQRTSRPILFYGSKLQEPIELDPLTNFTKVLVPFMAAQRDGRLLFLTKSASVDNLLELDHGGHTVLSWSLNAAEVSEEFEHRAPPLKERLRAAQRCAEAGYEVRFVIMPVLPVDDWPAKYSELIRWALGAVRPSRVTLGGICSFPSALRIWQARIGKDHPLFKHVAPEQRGRRRFRAEIREAMYDHLIGEIRRRAPELPISLCLETPEMWQRVGLSAAESRCNCLLTSGREGPQRR